MVSNLAQYVARSPRYILHAHDNTLIRVAGPQQLPWEEGTQIANVSLSGLGFTAPADLCPIIGETIKIQFEVPGHQQLACLALVVRLDKIGKSTMLVAVKFVKLEMPQRLVLAQALARKLRDQMDQQTVVESKKWWEAPKVRMGFMLFFAALWLVVLNWFWFRS